MITYYTKEGRFTTEYVSELPLKKLYRENGPSLTWTDGSQLWYRNEKLHREDGPSYINNHNGSRYYLFGIRVSKEECEKYGRMTDEEKLIWQLANL